MLFPVPKKPLKLRILSALKENWKDPEWFYFEILPLLLSPLFRLIRGNKGVKVVEEEWDNLIILDACRYDIFCKILGKKVPFRISRGSHTTDFLLENFWGKKFPNIIYISTNPFVDLYFKKNFYKIVPLWKFGWNRKFNTVLPSTVVKTALLVRRKYPNKRLIIHFAQPHAPFLKSRLKDSDFLDLGKKKTRRIKAWFLAARGIISKKEIWKAYENNVRIAVKHALKLAKKLKGRTIITSDHGETLKLILPFFILIAEHQPGIYISDLIKVPWYKPF